MTLALNGPMMCPRTSISDGSRWYSRHAE
jgi:hypothetical protein